MNLSALLGSTAAGGGGNTDKTWLFFKSSQIWVVPFDMEIIIHAIGAGGHGGRARYSNSPNHMLVATGAGGPAYTRKRARLLAGTVIDISIGAAPTNYNLSAASTQVITDGEDGGDTIVEVGTEFTLIAGGGKRGRAQGFTSGTTTNMVPGGEGGVASGGDFNANGMRGGNFAGFAGATGSNAWSTGAGAVDLLGMGLGRGGDVTNKITGDSLYGATGGGGIANAGEDHTLPGNSSNGTYGGDGGAELLAMSTPSQSADIPILGGRLILGYINAVGKRGTKSNSAAVDGSGHLTGGTGQATSSTTASSAGSSGNFAGSGGAATSGTAATNSKVGTLPVAQSSGGVASVGASQLIQGTPGSGVVALELLI